MTDILLATSDQARRVLEQHENSEEKRRAKLAPPGSLGLPQLLDERRLEYLIPDGMFQQQPCYDRIYVYQIPPEHVIRKDREASKSAFAIRMSGGWRDMEQDRAHRGIIVSAGLSAWDHLVSHGMGLGHIVNFAFFSVLRHFPDDDQNESIVPLHAGQLISSEDTQRMLRTGELSIRQIETPDGIRHVYRTKDGKEFKATIPFQFPEY